MDKKYRYYKGEHTNPFEEVNDKQGAWCMRYNEIAAMFWYVEYYWVNGAEKYSKLEERNPAYFFEKYKEPQKEFANIIDAILEFSTHSFAHKLIKNGCKLWIEYLYKHGIEERFYSPQFEVTKDYPIYFRWYKGEATNPFSYLKSNTEINAGFWWDFEFMYLKQHFGDIPSAEVFTQHLKVYLCNIEANSLHFTEPQQIVLEKTSYMAEYPKQ